MTGCFSRASTTCHRNCQGTIWKSSLGLCEPEAGFPYRSISRMWVTNGKEKLQQGRGRHEDAPNYNRNDQENQSCIWQSIPNPGDQSIQNIERFPAPAKIPCPTQALQSADSGLISDRTDAAFRCQPVGDGADDPGLQER